MAVLAKHVREIQVELEATGLPWSLEHSRKHMRIILAGEQVGVVSRGARMAKPGGLRNLTATIKRAARRHLIRPPGEEP